MARGECAGARPGIIVWAWLLGAAGCAQLPLSATVPGGVSPEIKTVAVLPFANVTDEIGAPQVVQQALVASLQRSELFAVIEPGRVTRFLRNHRALRAGGIEAAVSQMMWEALDADGLLTGTIVDYRDEIGVGALRVPRIELAMRLIDARTGVVLWSAYAALDGTERITVFERGKIWTIAELASVVSDELVASIRSPSIAFKQPLLRAERRAREENATGFGTVSGFDPVPETPGDAAGEVGSPDGAAPAAAPGPEEGDRVGPAPGSPVPEGPATESPASEPPPTGEVAPEPPPPPPGSSTTGPAAPDAPPAEPPPPPPVTGETSPEDLPADPVAGEE